MEIFVHPMNRINIESAPIEVVERKGRGHPDTLCDAIAEVLSSDYARYCISKFGGIAHHWFDKVVLFGAEASISFGSGKLIKPYRIAIYGKAVRCVEGEDIPIAEIARQAVTKVMSPLLHGFDPTTHLFIEDRSVDHHGTGNKANRYRPVTTDEFELPQSPRQRLSNDCNLCTAFAPFSQLEEAVLSLEQWMTGTDFRLENPNIGSDIKVIGWRRGSSMNVEINVPFIANRVQSLDEYRKQKQCLKDKLINWLKEHKGEIFTVNLNPGDEFRQPYLVALGSAADTGDVGVVGRGNRINGLITPLRPMSIEASNGKNPLDHTGKIYAMVAQRLSKIIFNQFAIANEVHLTTFKSRPLEDPHSVIVYLNRDIESYVHENVKKLILDEITKCSDITNDFIYTGVTMY